MVWSLKIHFAVAATLRLLLICYARIHDVVFEVRFTDIDYTVFTDAAKYVVSGHSPYDRATYRYTPLIAWILTPSIFLEMPEFGKLLFTAFDLVSALLVYAIVLQDTKGDEKKATISACIVLYNPLSAVVSARGNAESLLSMIVLWILYLLGSDSNIGYRRWLTAAVIHGLAAHLKIYPLIYLPSIFFNSAAITRGATLKTVLWKFMTNHRGVVYGLVCIATFALLTLGFYSIYGRVFLDEALLYHLSRRDVKHNFSPYFYILYLTQDVPEWAWIGSVAFIPQVALVLFFSWLYRDDLAFSWFASTFAFVAFNKVCTSQYFVWYLTLVPLIWYKLLMNKSRLVKLLGSWVGTQAVWLGIAYLLEFRGWNVFVYVWMASLLFLAVNNWVLGRIVEAYEDKLRKRS